MVVYVPLLGPFLLLMENGEQNLRELVGRTFLSFFVSIKSLVIFRPKISDDKSYTCKVTP